MQSLTVSALAKHIVLTGSRRLQDFRTAQLLHPLLDNTYRSSSLRRLSRSAKRNCFVSVCHILVSVLTVFLFNGSSLERLGMQFMQSHRRTININFIKNFPEKSGLIPENLECRLIAHSFRPQLLQMTRINLNLIISR